MGKDQRAYELPFKNNTALSHRFRWTVVQPTWQLRSHSRLAFACEQPANYNLWTTELRPVSDLVLLTSIQSKNISRALLVCEKIRRHLIYLPATSLSDRFQCNGHAACMVLSPVATCCVFTPGRTEPRGYLWLQTHDTLMIPFSKFFVAPIFNHIKGKAEIRSFDRWLVSAAWWPFQDHQHI